MQLPYHRQALASLVQSVYHLAVATMCVLALLAVGARQLAVRVSKPRAKTKELARAEHEPQRVMNVHIHL